MTESTSVEQPPPAAVSLAEAFRFWVKLGFISFGGPAGQIAVMHQELVERRCWISEGRFLHALNYCMVLPGPEAQQLATYIGWLMHRTWGGLIAGGLFVLPSLALLVLLSWIYVTYGQVPLVAAVFYGIKPAVVAIVCFAAYRIGSRVIHTVALGAIAAIAFLSIFSFNLPFPWIVLAAGVIGYFGGRANPDLFGGGAAHGNSKKSYGRALIDDDTPSPPHARSTWRQAVAIFGVAIALWVGALAAIDAIYGSSGTLFQMGWFFTKAALVTFGGAYAVLPYVVQGAVEHYGWLTALQMIDGLALGETTPGPLIMVVAFVGYLGAHADAVHTGLAPALAGTLGAVVVTYFTFLPSFFFIFIGAPFVEATRGNLHLTSALNAITAAAVGVLLNLAVFFAYHVFWPATFQGAFAWPSALIGVAAAAALFRFKLGIIPVVLASGAAGLLLSLAAVL